LVPGGATQAAPSLGRRIRPEWHRHFAPTTAYCQAVSVADLTTPGRRAASIAGSPSQALDCSFRSRGTFRSYTRRRADATMRSAMYCGEYPGVSVDMHRSGGNRLFYLIVPVMFIGTFASLWLIVREQWVCSVATGQSLRAVSNDRQEPNRRALEIIPPGGVEDWRRCTLGAAYPLLAVSVGSASLAGDLARKARYAGLNRAFPTKNSILPSSLTPRSTTFCASPATENPPGIGRRGPIFVAGTVANRYRCRGPSIRRNCGRLLLVTVTKRRPRGGGRD
jgi:hypothetical protein